MSSPANKTRGRVVDQVDPRGIIVPRWPAGRAPEKRTSPMPSSRRAIISRTATSGRGLHVLKGRRAPTAFSSARRKGALALNCQCSRGPGPSTRSRRARAPAEGARAGGVQPGPSTCIDQRPSDARCQTLTNRPKSLSGRRAGRAGGLSGREAHQTTVPACARGRAAASSTTLPCSSRAVLCADPDGVSRSSLDLVTCWPRCQPRRAGHQVISSRRCAHPDEAADPRPVAPDKGPR
jgi:hypothetical protein